jgi:pilus assembly protein CpaE
MMITNALGKVNVLILRDQLPSSGQPGEEITAESLLASDGKFHVSVAPAAYGEGVRAARQQRPDIIVFDGVLGAPESVVTDVDEASPRSSIIVLLNEADLDSAHDCILAGARACLQRPTPADDLVHTILQLHEKAQRRRKQAQVAPEEGGHLIAVRGSKGGVGATVLAVNLAISLYQQSERRVCLVDGNLFGGDVSLALDILTSRSLTDLIPNLHALTDDLVAATMVRHSSGIDVLAAPNELERAESVTPEQFQRILEALCTRYDFVVVDTASFLDQNSLVVLDMASIVLLICTPEIAALKNAARFLKLGSEFGYAVEKLWLVVNRLASSGSIVGSDIENHLHYRISAGIPSDGAAVVQSLNRGDPLMTTAPKSPVGRSIQALALRLLEIEGWAFANAPSSSSKIQTSAFARLGGFKILPAAFRFGSGA